MPCEVKFCVLVHFELFQVCLYSSPRYSLTLRRFCGDYFKYSTPPEKEMSAFSLSGWLGKLA
jgi:hypothetical protein